MLGGEEAFALSKKYTNSLTEFKATNEIINGDFSNGISHWRALFAEVKTVNNVVEFLSSHTSTSSRFQTVNSLEIKSNEVIYIGAWVKSTSNRVGIGSAAAISKVHSGNGEFEWLSFSYRYPTVTSFYPSITDQRTTDVDTVFLKKYIYINLTDTFGVGNEPTRNEMDELLKRFPDRWFDGTVQLTTFKDFAIHSLNEIRKLKSAITALGGSV